MLDMTLRSGLTTLPEAFQGHLAVSLPLFFE
jgi:hypothetical protein